MNDCCFCIVLASWGCFLFTGLTLGWVGEKNNIDAMYVAGLVMVYTWAASVAIILILAFGSIIMGYCCGDNNDGNANNNNNNNNNDVRGRENEIEVAMEMENVV